MGDQHSIPIHDEAISLPLEVQIGDNLLDLVHHHVHGEDIFPVGKHTADGNDDVVGLCIDIGRNNCGLSVCFDGGAIPVSPRRVIILRWHPCQSVQIFSHYITVDARNVYVEMLLLILRFHRDIVQNLFRGCPAADHVIDCVRRDPQRTF